MTRVVGGLLIALAVMAAHSAAFGAAKREQKRAYKPAERREAEDRASKASADDDKSAPATTYEQELQTARDKRDKDLDALNKDQPDQRTLEKRKQEIFAQYAAIVAALRDKYQASQPEGAASKPASRYNTKAKGGRDKKAEDVDEKQDDRKGGKAAKKKGKDSDADALAEALEKLHDEDARHTAKLEQLNGDLRRAQASNEVREIRKAEKAIEKENNTYGTRKTILERRVKELGGSITPPPAPAPAPAAKDTAAAKDATPPAAPAGGAGK
jgi:hypothetical protein